MPKENSGNFRNDSILEPEAHAKRRKMSMMRHAFDGASNVTMVPDVQWTEQRANRLCSAKLVSCPYHRRSRSL